jgi:flagella synthesis protein FlgN
MQDTDLLQQLIDDIGTARKLLELTDAEYQALAERDLAGLENLLTQKQTLLALLGQHGSSRSRALTSAGLTADRAGLQAYAAKSTVGTALLEHAEQLDATLEACRTANERNGKLIRTNQRAVGDMLQILQSSSQTPGLYDRRGAASKGAYQRPLSRA